jgi:hypothetical protein
LSVSSLSPPPFAITNGHTTLVHNGLSPSSSYDSLSPRGECPPFSLTHISLFAYAKGIYTHSTHITLETFSSNETTTNRYPWHLNLHSRRTGRGERNGSVRGRKGEGRENAT